MNDIRQIQFKINSFTYLDDLTALQKKTQLINENPRLRLCYNPKPRVQFLRHINLWNAGVNHIQAFVYQFLRLHEVSFNHP